MYNYLKYWASTVHGLPAIPVPQYVAALRLVQPRHSA